MFTDVCMCVEAVSEIHQLGTPGGVFCISELLFFLSLFPVSVGTVLLNLIHFLSCFSPVNGQYFQFLGLVNTVFLIYVFFICLVY